VTGGPVTGTVRCHDLVGARHVELHRPEALNAWTPEMGRELLAHRGRRRPGRARRAGHRRRARVLRGGRRQELLASGEPDLSTRLRETYNPVVATLRTMDKPVVGAIHGACAGLGVSLALACDLLLAADDAYLLLAFARIGVMPDGGALSFLAERVGLVRAAELAMLAEKLPAERAREWGLVNAVHPVDELQSAAIALTERLATGPTVALANTKRILTAVAQRHLDEQLEAEAARQQDHAATEDYAEGRTAFTEKRDPRFRGR